MLNLLLPRAGLEGLWNSCLEVFGVLLSSSSSVYLFFAGAPTGVVAGLAVEVEPVDVGELRGLKY